MSLVYAEGCGLQEAESARLDQTHSTWAKIDKTKEWTDYLSKKRQKFDGILMIYACGFGLCPLLEVILYRLLSSGGTLAVRGSKCTISIGRAIGGHGICPLYRGCLPFGESVRGFTVTLVLKPDLSLHLVLSG